VARGQILNRAEIHYLVNTLYQRAAVPPRHKITQTVFLNWIQST